MTKRLLGTLLAAVFLLAARASAIPLMKFDEAKIKREVWDPAVKTMPTKYSGTVTVDGKPLAGVRVTDGIHFVRTDRDGRYTIEVQYDAMTPVLMARTISACWPEGTWPVKDKKTGRLLFWKRVKDVAKTPDKVDFALTQRVIQPPFIVALGADPHENLWDHWNYVMPREIERGGNRVHLGMLLGDLTYAQLKGAEIVFSNFERYARKFPVSFLHVIGNHDLVGAPQDHELAGNGAFLKYLGPIRQSFDVAGVHVMLFNYWLVNHQAETWAERDLAAVPPETPVYIFTHSWGPYLGRICQRHPNVRLVQAGHSHKTMYCGKENNADFLTFYAYYRLLYIEGADYEFVDRARGGNAQYNYFHHRLGHPDAGTGLVTNAVVTNKSVALPGYTVKNKDGKETPPDPKDPFGDGDQYDLTFTAVPTGQKPATRFGVRVINERGYVFTFDYEVPSRTLRMAGRETFFDPSLVYWCQKTVHPPKEVWKAREVMAYYEADAGHVEKTPEQTKAYEEALEIDRAYEEKMKKVRADWEKENAKPPKITLNINVCKDRIQTFVKCSGNGDLAHFQFYRVGPAARIEYFAEGGEATFEKVQAFKAGAGPGKKPFTAVVQNQQP